MVNHQTALPKSSSDALRPEIQGLCGCLIRHAGDPDRRFNDFDNGRDAIAPVGRYGFGARINHGKQMPSSMQTRCQRSA